MGNKYLLKNSINYSYSFLCLMDKQRKYVNIDALNAVRYVDLPENFLSFSIQL
jgi:hypothetical protein